MSPETVISLATMRQLAHFAGSNLTDAQLEEVRPTFEDLRQRVRQLDELGLDKAEPASVFRAEEV